MIITFFNHGAGKAKGPMDYLMSEKDSEGKIRVPPPELISGDIVMTSMVIDMTQRKHKYTSGCVAFRENENPTPEQRTQILKSLRDSFCPGMGEDRVSMVVVEHRDKGNVEYHFCVANTDIRTGRQFNMNPPGEFAKKFAKDWQAIWNDKLGYDQVVEDPLKAQFSKFERVAEQFEKKNNETENKKFSRRRAKFKSRAAEEICDLIKDGKVNNRNELINEIKKRFKNVKVTRAGEEYLSLKFEGMDKAIRFDGKIFHKNANYPELLKEFAKMKEKVHLTPSELIKIKDRFEKSVEIRRNFNEKRYSEKKRVVLGYRPKPKDQTIKPIEHHINKPMDKVHVSQKAQEMFNKMRDKPLKPLKPKKQKNNTSHSGSKNASGGSGVIQLKLSLGNIQNQIAELSAKIGSGITPEEEAQINAQIAALRLQEEKIAQELKEAEIAELNRSTPKFK